MINMLYVKSKNYIPLNYDNIFKDEFVDEEPIKKSRLEEETDWMKNINKRLFTLL